MSYLFHFTASFKHNFCHFNYYFLIEFSRSSQEPNFFFSFLNTLKKLYHQPGFPCGTHRTQNCPLKSRMC